MDARYIDQHWKWHKWKSYFEAMFSPRSWGIGFDLSVSVYSDDTFHPTLYAWASATLGPLCFLLGTEKRLG